MMKSVNMKYVILLSVLCIASSGLGQNNGESEFVIKLKQLEYTTPIQSASPVDEKLSISEIRFLISPSKESGSHIKVFEARVLSATFNPDDLLAKPFSTEDFRKSAAEAAASGIVVATMSISEEGFLNVESIGLSPIAQRARGLLGHAAYHLWPSVPDEPFERGMKWTIPMSAVNGFRNTGTLSCSSVKVWPEGKTVVSLRKIPEDNPPSDLTENRVWILDNMIGPLSVREATSYSNLEFSSKEIRRQEVWFRMLKGRIPIQP